MVIGTLSPAHPGLDALRRTTHPLARAVPRSPVDKKRVSAGNDCEATDHETVTDRRALARLNLRKGEGG